MEALLRRHHLDGATRSRRSDKNEDEENEEENVENVDEDTGKPGHDAFKTFVNLSLCLALHEELRKGIFHEAPFDTRSYMELWSMKVSKVHLHQNTKANISWASDPIFRSPWSFSLVVLWEWRAVYLRVVCQLFIFICLYDVYEC